VRVRECACVGMPECVRGYMYACVRRCTGTHENPIYDNDTKETHTQV